MVVISLAPRLLSGSSGYFSFAHLLIGKTDTSLAPSKDLAVSSFDFAQDKPKLFRRFAKHIINYMLGVSCLSALDVSVRTSIPATSFNVTIKSLKLAWWLLTAAFADFVRAKRDYEIEHPP